MAKKYKFDNFITPIELSEWELLQVIDQNNGTANATIKITDVNGLEFGVEFSGFDYGNPNKDIESLRWEFVAYLQTATTCFQGFQENVVAIITSLNPKDRAGKEAFRAADYGLNEDEKQIRKEGMERFHQQRQTMQERGAAQAQKSAQEQRAAAGEES